MLKERMARFIAVLMIALPGAAQAQLPAGVSQEGDGSILSGRGRWLSGLLIQIGSDPASRYVLDGIAPFPAQATCRMRYGAISCERALQQEIARRLQAGPVRCRLSDEISDSLPAGGFPAKCAVGSTEIGLELVSLGVARATAARYAEAQAQADAKRLGYWGAN